MRKTARSVRLAPQTIPLEQTLAMLNQNNIVLTQTLSTFLARMEKLDREHVRLERETKEQFARIERILHEHSRILAELPEALRQKIGFNKQ